MTDDVRRLRDLLHGVRRAIVLTGAGISTESGIPTSGPGGGIWAEFDEAFRLAEACDLLLAAGSTLEVHPVASLPDVARRAGATLAIVDRGPTAYDEVCDLRIGGAIGDVFPRLV